MKQAEKLARCVTALKRIAAIDPFLPMDDPARYWHDKLIAAKHEAEMALSWVDR